MAERLPSLTLRAMIAYRILRIFVKRYHYRASRAGDSVFRRFAAGKAPSSDPRQGGLDLRHDRLGVETVSPTGMLLAAGFVKEVIGGAQAEKTGGQW